ncbi:MAG: hypothetical protein ACRDU8_06600 [Egibacteraceae bacterium]
MSAPTDPDEVLLAQLRAAANRHDPVPEAVLEASRAALAWRAVDAELAELTYDSLTDDRLLAGVRGDDGPRTLVFESEAVTVEVEVHPLSDHPGARLVGQLSPPQPAVLEVRHAAGVEPVVADDIGRFSVPRVAPGPVSLRCRLHRSGAVIQTAWTPLAPRHSP